VAAPAPVAAPGVPEVAVDRAASAAVVVREAKQKAKGASARRGGPMRPRGHQLSGHLLLLLLLLLLCRWRLLLMLRLLLLLLAAQLVAAEAEAASAVEAMMAQRATTAGARSA